MREARTTRPAFIDESLFPECGVVRRAGPMSLPSTLAGMSELSHRVESLSVSATMAVSAKARELKLAGEPVIGYGAGEPDFPTPPPIVAAAHAALDDLRNHKYTPAPGLPELREAVATKTKRDSGYNVDASQVVITNGGKHAVYSTFQVLVDPGDEVLLPAPFWVTYPEAAALAGGVPVVVSSDAQAGYRVTVDQLEAARTPHTKMLVFVSPSNPTGAVYPEAEVRAIGEWAAKHGIWVMTDEIYEHLVYGDAAFSSMPVVAPESAERCIVVNGVAKTYAMTGWRVGWMIAPPDAAAAASRLQSHLTSNVNNVAQRAAQFAVSGPLDDVHAMRRAFDRRRITMVEKLNAIDGVVCPEPHGAFYAFPNVEGLLGRDLAGRSAATSLELADVLLDEIKIAVVPGEAFGAPGHFRLSYALGDDDLAEGLDRLHALVMG
jgi:aspartate aminotransferase